MNDRIKFLIFECVTFDLRKAVLWSLAANLKALFLKSLPLTVEGQFQGVFVDAVRSLVFSPDSGGEVEVSIVRDCIFTPNIHRCRQEIAIVDIMLVKENCHLTTRSHPAAPNLLGKHCPTP